MRDAYIIDALRTPIGRVNGCLRHLPVAELLAPLLRELVARNSLDASTVDEVVVGNAAGPGGNPARLAVLKADLPFEVPGITVDRQCGSGLEAISMGARLIQSGAASLVIAGGVESASTAPLKALQNGESAPVFYSRAQFSPENIGDPEMGVAAENVASRYGVGRVEQDEYAYRSHVKTTLAQDQGLFQREILNLKTAAGIISDDECPRRNTSVQSLSLLPPVFIPNGTVTAGNACPVNDGAALVVISSESVSKAVHGSASDSRRLRFVDCCARGVDPNFLGIGPVPAVSRLLSRTGLSLDDVAQIELNEAFAAQVIASMQALEIDPLRLNPQGGAIAQGHPYGASGAILVTRLFHQLQSGQLGIATLGIGGGLGLAGLFERCH